MMQRTGFAGRHLQRGDIIDSGSKLSGVVAQGFNGAAYHRQTANRKSQFAESCPRQDAGLVNQRATRRWKCIPSPTTTDNGFPFADCAADDVAADHGARRFAESAAAVQHDEVIVTVHGAAIAEICGPQSFDLFAHRLFVGETHGSPAGGDPTTTAVDV